MGVHGLWELLAPVGRRVSVETLAGKKLAIDASIWMIQFMKAMRDEQGEMLRNAHILGFFRRICKLLFLRTKPVFVFDGATPALKRRTIAARRRHRENAQAKIRKTAEKLLLNHLKAKKLEDLAQEMKKYRQPKDKKDAKGKQVVSDESQSDNKTEQDTPLSQETLDEMLAASLAAEEEQDFNANKTTSIGSARQGEEDDEDDDEEMIFPVTSGNIDPSVLASLPPSMQLDLLVQMREKLMAENRQKYQKIKKTPTKFSELQIQSYLKTVAFRREIDEVQKSAAGSGFGGVQSSRIASEANREFIFSSSFTGDKQMLSAKSIEKDGDTVSQSVKKTVNFHSVKHSLLTSQTQSPSVPSVDKITSDFGNDVETYRDESGRVRVSRVRGMGIHMTRDLQRNLDLMKEYEQDYSRGDVHTDVQPKGTREISSAKGIPGTNNSHNASTSNEGNSRNASGKTGTLIQEDDYFLDDLSVQGSKTTIEISFLEGDGGMKDTDDNLFRHLVSGTSTSALFSASIQADRSKDESESECVWEEGTVGEKSESWQNDQNQDGKSSLAEDNSCEEYDVEWEEADCDAPKDVSHCQAEEEKNVSRGLLEEDADIQEAIRRSLQDIEIQKASSKSSSISNLGASSEDQNSVASPHVFTFEENRESTQLPLARHPERSRVSCTIVDVLAHLEHPFGENIQQDDASNFDGKSAAAEATNEKLTVSSELDDSTVRIPHTDEGIERHVNHEEQCIDTCEQAAVAPSGLRNSREDFVGSSANVGFKTVDDVLDTIPANASGNHTQTFESSHSVGRKGEISYSKQGPQIEEKAVNIDAMQEEVIGINSSSMPIAEGPHYRDEVSTQEDLNNHNDVSEANLDEEISLLRQERLILGDEQRKLERNAESVSSEMFAECQELLQMFGLPYIIAPMEAEAQCAYMEMLNLVDGVVTDDSDVFLFGARNVYKNIFDDRKYVETYFMKDIESELGLNRETLIRMALLLGSDYTEGVSGIGIVNAIEVVRAFPEEDGLQKFREWVESPDLSILGKLNSHTGSSIKKRSIKSSNKDRDGTADNPDIFPSEESVSKAHENQPSLDDILHIKEVFMSKHRNVSKNWHLPSSFPSDPVINAYTSPQIDDSTEPFMWGKPDLFLLRKLCWERFGWDKKKADELLVPVLKEYNKHETQLRLEAFYTFNERFAKIRSQRIKKAVKGITGKCSTDLMDNLAPASSSGKMRGRDPSSLDKHKPESCSEVKDNSTRKNSKKPRRQKTESPSIQSENRDGGNLSPKEGQRFDRSGLTANSRGKRGRGRGRWGERARRRVRVKEVLNGDSTEASSSDDCGDKGEMVKHIQVPEAMSKLRRSTRHRKHVQYAEEEVNMEKHVQYAEEEVNMDVDVHGLNGVAKEQGSVEQGSNILAGDVSDHEEGGSQIPDVSLSRDYFLSGGGFCMEESEIQGDAHHPAANPVTNSAEKCSAAWDGYSSTLVCQNRRPCSLDDDDDDSHSRDYLLSGGGFCRDESETQVDAAQLDASSSKEDLEPGCQTTEERGTSPATKHVDSSYPGEAEDGEANLGLRAMPSLRKKRRKV